MCAKVIFTGLYESLLVFSERFSADEVFASWYVVPHNGISRDVIDPVCGYRKTRQKTD